MDSSNQQDVFGMDYTYQQGPSGIDLTDQEEAPDVDFTDQQEPSRIPKMSHADEKRRARIEFEDETMFWADCPLTCDAPDCPIKGPHRLGRYLHHDEWAGSHEYFGSCNPPQEIVEAYDRLQNRAYESCSKDYDVVVGFYEAHCRSGWILNKWGEWTEIAL